MQNIMLKTPFDTQLNMKLFDPSSVAEIRIANRFSCSLSPVKINIVRWKFGNPAFFSGMSANSRGIGKIKISRFLRSLTLSHSGF